MTNSIFVPQKFNGERMVNDTPTNRKGSAVNATNTSTTPITIGKANSNITDQPTGNRITKAPPATILPALSPANSTVMISNPSSSHRTSSTSSIIQFDNKNDITLQPTLTQTPLLPMSSSPVPKIDHRSSHSPRNYWTKANVAILVQLHRKYVPSSDDNKKSSNEAWSHLTNEFNTITNDNRTQHAIESKWERLLLKYNEERRSLLNPTSNLANGNVSHWTHFQCLDEYLKHIPITDNSVYKKKSRLYEYSYSDGDYEDENESANNKRARFEKPPPTLAPVDNILQLHLLETQRLFTEKTMETQRLFQEQVLERQKSQIDMMRDNYEKMHKMNMKFVDMCDKVASRTNRNEARYLDLLEKYVSLKEKGSADTNETAVTAMDEEKTNEEEGL